MTSFAISKGESNLSNKMLISKIIEHEIAIGYDYFENNLELIFQPIRWNKNSNINFIYFSQI